MCSLLPIYRYALVLSRPRAIHDILCPGGWLDLRVAGAGAGCGSTTAAVVPQTAISVLPQLPGRISATGTTANNHRFPPTAVCPPAHKGLLCEAARHGPQDQVRKLRAHPQARVRSYRSMQRAEQQQQQQQQWWHQQPDGNWERLGEPGGDGTERRRGEGPPC